MSAFVSLLDRAASVVTLGLLACLPLGAMLFVAPSF